MLSDLLVEQSDFKGLAQVSGDAEFPEGGLVNRVPSVEQEHQGHALQGVIVPERPAGAVVAEAIAVAQEDQVRVHLTGLLNKLVRIQLLVDPQ